MKEIQVGNTARPFQAARDEYGVPHITAANWLDGLFGLGYMHGLDRGTQLLFARSVARGTAAEDLSDSPELLETDCLFRRVGLHLELERELRLYPDSIFRQVTAYCEGVNAGLKAMGRSWPMWATSFDAQPWTQTSVLLIGKLLSFGGLAVSQMQNERLLIELIHAGARDDALRELFTPRLDGVDLELVRQIKMANQLSDEALELLTDLPRLAGSNAWAVAPQRSATDGALLASDPHLEINRLPAIWYEASICWGEQGNEQNYVVGATLPGCPLFAVARTPRLSWGVTYMKGDTIDFFIEDCRPGGATGWQYRRGDDEWCDFQRRDEPLGRKSGSAEVLHVYENEQGVIDGDLDQLGEGLHLSLAWSGNAEGNGGAIATWLELVAANNAQEGMEIARHCPQPTLCFVFADADGHIGMQSCGRFPVRGGGHLGLAPIPAWDERNHWQGVVPVEQLPAVYDPPCGFVATANEEMTGRDSPLLVTQPLPDYRKRRIDERLEQLPAATVEDMQTLQYDVVSLQARDLLPVFLTHLPDGEIKSALEAWDLRYNPESTGASLFLQLYRNVMVQILGHRRAIGFRRMLYLCSRAGYSVMVLTAADRLLAHEDSHWWKEGSKGALIRHAAEQIDIASIPPWSKINNFHFTDRFFGNHQVGRILGFNSRQFPMLGCHATIFQGHVLQTAKRESTFAPSYHLVTDMSTDVVWTNLPGGPSENRFSKLYRCDVDRWLKGEFKPLRPKAE